MDRKKNNNKFMIKKITDLSLTSINYNAIKNYKRIIENIAILEKSKLNIIIIP